MKVTREAKLIEVIRDRVKFESTARHDFELCGGLEALLSEHAKNEIDIAITDAIVETLHWVLREVFEATP